MTLATAPPLRRRFAAFIVVSALFGVSRAALAAPSARLVYSRTEAAASCPAEGDLRDAVVTRLGYDPFADWAPKTLVVEIGRSRDRYAARLELVDAQGVSHGLRALSSGRATCREIFDATALAIAIALDALQAHVDPPPPAPLPSDPSPTSEPPAVPVPPASPPPVPPSDEPSVSPVAAVSGSSNRAWQWRAGLDLLGSIATAPSIAAGAEAFCGVRRGAWSLAVELRADAPASSAGAPGGGRVQSWLVGGGLAPCGHLGVAFACAVGFAGAMQAAGLDVTSPRTQSVPFLAAGGRLGVELPLSSTWALRLRGEVLGNLRPVTLALGEAIVWPAPAVVADAGGGLVAFWP